MLSSDFDSDSDECSPVAYTQESVACLDKEFELIERHNVSALKQVLHTVTHDDTLVRDTDNEYKAARPLVKQYLTYCLKKGGVVRVVYKRAKHRKFGRHYGKCRGAAPPTSLQGMNREIRAYLAKAAGYIDVDMKNAMPTILHGLAKHYNLDLHYIQECVENKQAVIDTICLEEGRSATSGKRLLLSCFTDLSRKWKSAYCHSLQRDALSLLERLLEDEELKRVFAEAHRIRKADCASNSNLNGSLMSNVYSHYESTVLCHAIPFITNVLKYPVGAAIFDGLLIHDPSGNFDNECFERLNAYVREQTGLSVVFCKKPFDETRSMGHAEEEEEEAHEGPKEPETYEEYCEKDFNQYIQVKDKYYNANRPWDEPINQKVLREYFPSIWLPCERTGRVRLGIELYIEDMVHYHRGYVDAQPWPDETNKPANVFNTWQPYAFETRPDEAQEKDEHWTTFSHFLKPFCNNNDEDYEWFLDFLANLVQYPQNKPTVAPIFVSVEGCGKGYLTNILTSLLGFEQVHDLQMSTLFDSFSHKLHKSTLIVPNECSAADWKSDTKRAMLRHMVTERHLDYNIKYGSKFTKVSFHRFIFMMNTKDSSGLPMNADARRWKVINCDSSLAPQRNGFDWHFYQGLLAHASAERDNFLWTVWCNLKRRQCPERMEFSTMPPPNAFELSLRMQKVSDEDRWLMCKLLQNNREMPTLNNNFALPGKHQDLFRDFKSWCADKELTRSASVTVQDFKLWLNSLSNSNPKFSEFVPTRFRSVGIKRARTVDADQMRERWRKIGLIDEHGDTLDELNIGDTDVQNHDPQFSE